MADWDLRERRCTDENGRYIPRDHCAHPILAIELGLEMNLLSILPAALYDLSRYGPAKIMAGTVAPLTTFQRLITQLTGSLSKPEIRPVRLSRDLLCRTLRGREAAQRYLAGFIEKEIHCRSPAQDCLNRFDNISPSKQCHESFYFIMLNVLRSIGGISCGRDADPLFSLVQVMEMLSRTDFSDGQRQCGLKLCQACKTDFAASAAKAREDIWNIIPQCFSLVEGDEELIASD